MADAHRYFLSPIECCPTGILFEIEKHLRDALDPWRKSTKQMLALRRTSRRIESVFTQVAVNKIRFSCDIESRNGLTRTCIHNGRYALFPAPASFAPFVKSIEMFFGIDSSESPNYDPEEIMERFSSLWGEVVRYTSLNIVEIEWKALWGSKGWKDVPMRYQCLATRLGHVIDQTTAGQLYRFRCKMPMELQIQMPVHQLLQPFSHLRDLDLQITEAGQPLQLPSLIGDTIRHNPCLQSLQLDSGSSSPLCTLEELFPPELNKLALERILIHGVLSHASSDAVSVRPSPPLNIPRLRNLKYLTIRFRQEPPSAMANLDRLWDGLKASGTQLRKLSLEYGISNALMEYLCSYEGLIEGRFTIYVPNNEDTLPCHFANTILHHISSLADLTIFPNDDERLVNICRKDMVTDPTMWPAPSSFSWLRHLRLVPPLDWSLSAKNFQRLLDYTLGMPVLEELYIHWLNQDVQTFQIIFYYIGGMVYIRKSNLKRIHLIIVDPLSGTHATPWTLEYPQSKGDDSNRQYQLNGFRFRPGRMLHRYGM
ncbi:hypothetical protein AX16_006847 [Volvariella volvacea WC 439]|nr:hypothetical protein AX16_006847 [Volvariella volvacea WC 439]